MGPRFRGIGSETVATRSGPATAPRDPRGHDPWRRESRGGGGLTPDPALD